MGLMRWIDWASMEGVWLIWDIVIPYRIELHIIVISIHRNHYYSR